MFEMFQLMP